MARVEERIASMGLVLPPPTAPPPGVTIPFEWARVRGSRCLLSGHGAIGPEGAPAEPFGRVPSEVSLEQAKESARAATLAMLSTLIRTVGDLDRISAWLFVNGWVNADPGCKTTAVLDPCSNLLIDLFGQEIGAHARTAIGVSALPLNLPVVISAEVEIA